MLSYTMGIKLLKTQTMVLVNNIVNEYPLSSPYSP